MKAAVILRYGDASGFTIRNDIPTPKPAPNQVLIQVKAAGINPLDWRIRNGDLKLFLDSRFPMVLGNDIAGIVVDTGSDVTNYKIGDAVFCMMDADPEPPRRGFAKPGGYAEFAVTREDTLAPMPQNIDFLEAASIPLSALTAYQSLHHKVQIQRDDSVLINGASGGVGIFAVQIAKAMGLQVTGVCSSKNTDKVKALGADSVVSYQDTPIKAMQGRFDLVYDVATNQSFQKCRHLLKPNGVYLSNVATASTLISGACAALFPWSSRFKRNQHAWVRSSGKDLQAIAHLIAEGKLKTYIDHVYSLEEVQQAHRQIETGHTQGKLVVNIAD